MLKDKDLNIFKATNKLENYNQTFKSKNLDI